MIHDSDLRFDNTFYFGGIHEPGQTTDTVAFEFTLKRKKKSEEIVCT